MREATAITRERKTIQQCRRELKKLCKDHKPIQSQALAVGLTTACVLWMRLGDPQQYGSAGAYRKAMGLNLTERSSGMYKGKLKLSKRGQRLARKWLYFSALRWMREPSVKMWLENKKRRDGGKGSLHDGRIAWPGEASSTKRKCFQLTLRGGGACENIFHFLLDPSPGHAERPS